MADKMYYCKTCNRTMDENQFYSSKRLDRYPNDGKLSECKKCLTRHVNNWDPSTYLWILEEVDVPYIEEEWNKLLATYGKDPKKISGMTILGRYLSKMKLKQFCNDGWADTERLKAEADAKKSEIMARSGYSGEEIEQALQEQTYKEYIPAAPAWPGESGPVEAAPPMDLFETDFVDTDLTDEDRKYLTLKWGKTYKPYEWVQLEQYYQEMMESFDIQTPSHIDYLKLICKTSLKAHQLIDLGDIEGFQKMSKVYDTLMKSAKFTAVQNKAESGEFIDSIGELVLLCEREGFVPRFYTAEPKDKVDETLRDMRGYTNTLVTEEMNLGTLIESAVKALQKQAEIEEDEDIDDDDDDLSYDEISELRDKDYEEYTELLEEEAEDDENLIRQLLDGVET